MVAPTDPLFIQSYGDGNFRIGGADYTGSVIVTRDAVHPWAVTAMADITHDSFDVLADPAILLIGTGKTMTLLDPELRAALGRRGFNADAMDTGAACRTFNILLAEDRPVAVALIAVD